MLQQIKTSLRIVNDAFDEEILMLIESCKAELNLAGVSDINESDPLITLAITFFAKAHFGYDNDSEKFNKSYERLKKTLTWRVTNEI